MDSTIEAVGQRGGDEMDLAAADILMDISGSSTSSRHHFGDQERYSTTSPDSTISAPATIDEPPPRSHWRHLKQDSLLQRALATPPATPENNGESPKLTPSPPPSDTFIPSYDPACTDCRFISEINLEQFCLLQDPRSQAQLQWFKKVENSKPATFYSQLAPIGIHILEHGRAAQTSWDTKNADFLVGDCSDLEHWLINGTGDKLFVLRDREWFNTRPKLSGSEFFQELQVRGMNKTLLLEVQELGKQINEIGANAVQPMTIDKILQRWSVKDQSLPPINLLNLMCKDDAYQPWPLAKHCNLLNQAAASSASIAHSAFYATAGKESTEVMTKLIDLESCMHFQIFGQAGAISTWHMDAIGPYTYITLEPNVEGQPAEHVLKLWAYVRTDHLSEAERAKIKERFKQDNEGFKPNPEHIRILALVAGDTLIMPPGTIHAPITITDCLFRGGMVMQKRQMWRSMREWRFCSENDRCTNENQPRQSRSILDFFKREVYADPAACGYGKKNGMGLADFESDWTRLSGASMVCSCKSGCKTRKCGCQLNTQRCGNMCHGGVAKCENPYGCEVEEVKES